MNDSINRIAVSSVLALVQLDDECVTVPHRFTEALLSLSPSPVDPFHLDFPTTWVSFY